MELLSHFQTSTVALLKFGNGILWRHVAYNAVIYCYIKYHVKLNDVTAEPGCTRHICAFDLVSLPLPVHFNWLWINSWCYFGLLHQAIITTSYVIYYFFQMVDAPGFFAIAQWKCCIPKWPVCKPFRQQSYLWQRYRRTDTCQQSYYRRQQQSRYPWHLG